MQRGNRFDRGAQGSGYSLAEQEETKTWGQGFRAPAAVTLAAPGLYDQQLVMARYARPTTWTFTRIFDFGDSGGFVAGDSVAVSWKVRIGIGTLNSEFDVSDLFTFPLPATTTLPFFGTMQIPAKQIQVTLTSVLVKGAAAFVTPRMAAMVAPVVE